MRGWYRAALVAFLLVLASACDESEHAVHLGADTAPAERQAALPADGEGDVAHAPTPRTLGWGDLIPETEAFEDPFAALESAQLQKLGLIVRVSTMEAERPESVTDGMREEVQGYERELTEQGIDIEALLARRDEIRRKREARASAVVPALDGVPLRMPGYLLPLEYEVDKVIEFLLVPWVGACIHTPPPAPNQIVHVRLAEAIEYPGYFRPVWVEGAMSTKATAKELFHVDGRAVVPTAYSMGEARVSPYEE